MILRALMVAASVAAFAGPAAAQESFRMGGGPSGGAWHPAWSAGVQLLSKELGGKYRFQYAPTAGSVDVVRRIRLGELASGWAHIPQLYESWTGTGLFEKDGQNRDYRVIANVQPQTQVVAVLADNPIKSYADMKGKVVNVLAKGSGGNVNCVNMFEALGMMDQIDARYLGFAASGRALGDRQIDVFCAPGVPFTIPALTEISLRRPVRYVSLTEEEQKKIIDKHRFYSPVTIPVQAEVKGMDAPARTVGYDVWWIVNKSMSDEAVHDILSVIAAPENLKSLTATASYWQALSGNFEALKSQNIYVHPAAAKYWRSRGANVPDEIVRGHGQGS